MTLAVAAKYPWSAFSDLMRLGVPISQAVIMASDSRWTYYDNYYLPYEDIGTKLFKLRKDCGAVYSGDVQAGEHCITQLIDELAKVRVSSDKISLSLAESTFYGVYKYHEKERKKQAETLFPLYIMVGVCDVVGKASLICFSSESNFKPCFIEGVYGIGIREAYATFEEKFKKEIESKVKEELKIRYRYPDIRYGSIQEDAEHVGIVLADSLKDVINSANYEGIGGKIQYAIIAKDGFQTIELAETTTPTNEGVGWSRVTIKPEEITTYREKFNLGANYENISSFGVYKIYD